ncbi:PITH domain-containing protein 1 isoform X1 [Echinops telfairi]|uniref:PITH domain-containing protein 1 isoform X1 n=1 Tax=Echinops telfairi TaxID=9371 RepID=A0AC55DTN6_ECHTE|nr:PITH domain-containing protein 1 isoform X1 [Echinops telfairi]
MVQLGKWRPREARGRRGVRTDGGALRLPPGPHGGLILSPVGAQTGKSEGVVVFEAQVLNTWGGGGLESGGRYTHIPHTHTHTHTPKKHPGTISTHHSGSWWMVEVRAWVFHKANRAGVAFCTAPQSQSRLEAAKHFRFSANPCCFLLPTSHPFQYVESDADEELLFNIPFTGNVKLKGIIVMGEDDDSHPSEMRLYKNIPQMSFGDTDREPDQTFSLNRDVTGELEYATNFTDMK